MALFYVIGNLGGIGAWLTGPARVAFMIGLDRYFPPAFGKVHPKWKTPYVAILLAAVLGMALVMSRSFEALTETFVLAIWPFYALGIAAIYRLRRLRPDMPRPYKAIGYPVVPAIFIVSVAAFVVNALIHEPIPTTITFALILAGIPVYHFAFGRHAQRV